MPKVHRTLAKRLQTADPVASWGQRIYEWGTAYWPQVTAFFIAGGGMSALAVVTDWAQSLGPLGIGLICLGSALTAWVCISAGQSYRAKRRLHDARAEATEKWKQTVDNINPLASEFHTKRINIADISSPIDNRIKEKRFIDCEIIGPRVITFIGHGSITGSTFADCDFVCVKENAWINNATVFENVTIIGGVFWRCTILMQVDFIRKLGFDPPVISLTGDPSIDSRSHRNKSE